jgi:hypothetical protein
VPATNSLNSPTTSGGSKASAGAESKSLLSKTYTDDVGRNLIPLGFNVNVGLLAAGLGEKFTAICITALPLPIPQPDSTDVAAKGIPQLSPVEAAHKLAAFFSHVRSNEIKASGNGVPSQKEPLGMVLDVQVSMENARDVPVDVYWEFIGAGSESKQLNADWVQSTPAYRLNATDDSDGGTFRLWVPLPSETGDYAIALTARSTDGELPNASILSATFH